MADSRSERLEQFITAHTYHHTVYLCIQMATSCLTRRFDHVMKILYNCYVTTHHVECLHRLQVTLRRVQLGHQLILENLARSYLVDEVQEYRITEQSKWNKQRLYFQYLIEIQEFSLFLPFNNCTENKTIEAEQSSGQLLIYPL